MSDDKNLLTTEFRLEGLRGTIDLDEREGNCAPFFNSNSLIDDLIEDAEIEIGYSESSRMVEPHELDHCWVKMAAIHQKNEETGRAFHARLGVKLPWTQVRQLHTYLGFMLAKIAP